MSAVFSCVFLVFKQKTADEVRISDWSSDVCSSDLPWSGSTNGWRPSGWCSAYARSLEPLACLTLFVDGRHDIRQSALQCHPARTGDAICQRCVRGHRGVRQLPCSAIPLHTGGPPGSDPIANAALCGGEPDPRDNGGHPRSRQPSPLACLPFYNPRSEEHTSELHSLLRIPSAVYCLNKQQQTHHTL